MKIIYSKKFQNSLANIVDFIAQEIQIKEKERFTKFSSEHSNESDNIRTM